MVIMWLIMINNNTGWWFFATPLKNHGVKVSWDDDIPNWMESQNPNVPNHQPSIGLKPQFFLIFSVWGIIPSISQTRRCLACFWWNWLPQDVPNIRYLSPWSIYIYIYLSIYPNCPNYAPMICQWNPGKREVYRWYASHNHPTYKIPIPNHAANQSSGPAPPTPHS